MRKIDFRPQARLDLHEIWHYIARNSISNASSVTIQIEAAIRQLREMPTIGHNHEQVRNRQLRFWSVHSYLIAYRFDDRSITIVRIVHGARDLKKIFRR